MASDRMVYALSVADINYPESSVGTDLIGVMARIRRALRPRVGTTGGVSQLTDSQRELVRYVRLNPDCRIGDVAVKLHLAPNTVSTLVGSLSTLVGHLYCAYRLIDGGTLRGMARRVVAPDFPRR
jgi:DNA-binding CsgD family transcriptional regulator